jgi:hypothetical protein
MKPRSKSVWITPAACGAFEPAFTGHARISLGPRCRRTGTPAGVDGPGEAVERGLFEPVVGEHLRLVVGVQLGEFALDLGADRDDLGARRLGVGADFLRELALAQHVALVHVGDVTSAA